MIKSNQKPNKVLFFEKLTNKTIFIDDSFFFPVIESSHIKKFKVIC